MLFVFYGKFVHNTSSAPFCYFAAAKLFFYGVL